MLDENQIKMVRNLNIILRSKRLITQLTESEQRHAFMCTRDHKVSAKDLNSFRAHVREVRQPRDLLQKLFEFLLCIFVRLQNVRVAVVRNVFLSVINSRI